MADQSHESRPRMPVLHSFTNEILSIRTELATAIQQSNRLRAEASRLNTAAIAIDQQIASLEQRLRQMETTQRQLLHYRSSDPFNLPEEYTNLGNTSGPTPVAPLSGGQYNIPAPPLPGPFQPFPYQPSPVRSAQSPTDPDSTPCATSARPLGTQEQNKKRPDNENNVHYLPSVIEKILAWGNQYQKRKEICDVVVGRQGDTLRKCQRHLFNMQCFREDHFRFCGRHMRTIVRGQYACRDGNNNDCLPVKWEDREDWELMVDQAYKAGNFGNHNVNPDQLKRALFPPVQYPHWYT